MKQENREYSKKTTTSWASEMETNEAHGGVDALSFSVPYAQFPKQCSAYRLKRQLGKGSQGHVWLAEHKQTGEQVAIKQLSVHSAKTWKQYELFQREAEILSSVSVPGVASFYEYIEDLSVDPPVVCIVQQYIEGQTLAEMLQNQHRFSAETVYDIIRQTLVILQHLHQHEPPIVHRDIKPSNLMLTHQMDGTYKVTLLDFGAVANPQVQNGGSTVAGTFGYMPPEQLMGQSVPASDIYALGAVAVELLSGTSPADIEVCDFRLVIEPHLEHLPKHVVQVLSMMLEPSMDRRFYDHETLIAQFSAFAKQRKPSVFHALRGNTTKKLEDVTAICQPGNYELWQSLDPLDMTLPRLPFLTDNAALMLNETKERLPMPMITGVSLAIFLLLSIVGFYLAMSKLAFLSIFFLLFIGARWISKVVEYNSCLETLRLSTLAALPKIASQDISDAQTMLREGTKVIGKIIYISYYPVHQNNVQSFSQTLEQTNDFPYYVFVPNKPNFYVRYQFQYKYQNQSITFYGELYTHQPPENLYKVGDHLPLLVNISQAKSMRGMQTLRSIPYPYPFAEVTNINDVLFKCDIPDSVLCKETQIKRMNAGKLYYQDCKKYHILGQCLGDDEAPIQYADSLPSKPSFFSLRKHFYHLAIHMGHHHAKQFHGAPYASYMKQDVSEFTPTYALQLLEKFYGTHFPQLEDEIQKWRALSFKLYCVEDAELRALSRNTNDEAYQIYLKGMEHENKQDYTAAIKYYEEAVQKNFPQAASRLGMLYADVKQDVIQAIYWFEKAKNIGDSLASQRAKLLIDSIRHDKHKLYKIAALFDKNHDRENAIIWYVYAANEGNKIAAFMLGGIYKAQKNYEQAGIWYKRAVNMGENQALSSLGMLYRDIGDYAQAVHWFEKAVQIAQDKQAASSLGLLYETLLDNKEKAIEWYKTAVHMGNVNAQKSLDRLRH